VWLDLSYNNISDISPLVENSGLSAGDTVYLSGNPLSPTSIDDYVPQLEARGVAVALVG
jgi:Leucine-rich repeat (LRR) protein